MRPLLLALLLAPLLLAPPAIADPPCGDTLDGSTPQRCLRDADALARQHGVTIVGKACDAADAC